MVEIVVNNPVQQAIRSKFIEFCDTNEHEPRYANCEIEWLDDHNKCEVTIKMSSDVVKGEDDEIFYYCDSLKDLESLTEAGCEDFIVTEVYSFEDEL